MIFSMTGYGRGEVSSENYRFTVEMRSVNHRFCDISIRMPRKFSSLEERLRQLVAKRISRGKIDVFINYEELSERERSISTDIGLAIAYVEAANALKTRFNLEDDITLSTLIRMPDLFQVVETEHDEEEIWKIMGGAARIALDSLVEMRGIEGGKLIGDISMRLNTLSSLILRVEERAPFIIDEYRERLNVRLKELLAQNMPDENRIAAEVVLFADKCGIDEELTRFKSHLAQAAQCCESNEPVGRKFDFILQEINREVNTIGSKANDLMISGTIVDIKSEAEKIREQIQNLE